MPVIPLRPLLLAATCALVVLAPGTSAVAAGAGAGAGDGSARGRTVTVLDRSLIAPVQLAEERHRLYVADSGSSTVSRLTGSGLLPVASGPTPGEVAGVALNDRGDLAWTSTDYETGDTRLMVRLRRGGVLPVDLSGYERDHNPDGAAQYGVTGLTGCDAPLLEPYTGQVDSHPYAVAALPHGAGWVVADAGGNDLLRVDPRGRVSTLAVLPPQSLTVTPQIAADFELPGCAVGTVYRFEPVPTDVEVDHDGRLVVSLLPGGAEDDSLGARGSVWRYDLRGRGRMLAGGFLGATNVALGPDHQIFVAELFRGRISVIDRNGRVAPYLDLPDVLSLAWLDGTLYAGTIGTSDPATETFTPGTLVAIR